MKCTVTKEAIVERIAEHLLHNDEPFHQAVGCFLGAEVVNEDKETKKLTIKTIPNSIGSWDFIEKYLPDYTTNETVSYVDDLNKILYGEEEHGDCAWRLKRKHLWHTMPHHAMKEEVKIERQLAMADLYEGSIESYLKQTNN